MLHENVQAASPVSAGSQEANVGRVHDGFVHKERWCCVYIRLNYNNSGCGVVMGIRDCGLWLTAVQTVSQAVCWNPSEVSSPVHNVQIFELNEYPNPQSITLCSPSFFFP